MSATRIHSAQGLISANRCLPKHQAKPSNSASVQGLVYERKVVAALAVAFADFGFDLSHNPWFEYTAANGYGLCCPDILLALQSGPMADKIFCIEVKLTWVPEAMEKLLGLYCPVISKALGQTVQPLVICKNLTSAAPKALHMFQDAVEDLDQPLLHWLGSRPVVV